MVTLVDMVHPIESKILKFIRRVMPSASETELRKATAAFDEYMAVVWEILERIEREKPKIDSPGSEVRGKVVDTN